MTIKEAIVELGALNGIYNDQVTTALIMGIRSLEAWDEVIEHLEIIISEMKSTEMDQDSKSFCHGLTFALAMAKRHLKGVGE